MGSRRSDRRRSSRRLLSSGRDLLGEPIQVERPALIAAHALALLLPAVAVAVEVAVLELDASAIRRLGDEAHLDLAGLVGIGLDLPLRTDVPAEQNPVGRL